MTGLVVWVTFRVRSGDKAEFERLVRTNAATSLALEPHCHRFDVLTPHDPNGPDIALYECYADADAFDEHLASTHFATFDHATASMVTEKQVSRFTIDLSTIIAPAEP